MTWTCLFLNGQTSRKSFGACKSCTHVFFQRISILTVDFNTSLVVYLTNVPTLENFALILFFLFLVGTSFSRLVQRNTRQGRRQERQVPKLISPEEEKEKQEEKNKRERERCTHHHDHHHQPLHPSLIMVIVVCQHRQRRCHHQQHRKQQRSSLPKIKMKRNHAGWADKDETFSTTDHTKKCSAMLSEYL